MPLAGTSSVLSATLRAALLAAPAAQAVDGPALTALCDAIASTVVAHIVANATVTGSGVAPPGGGPVAVTGVVT